MGRYHGDSYRPDYSSLPNSSPLLANNIEPLDLNKTNSGSEDASGSFPNLEPDPTASAARPLEQSLLKYTDIILEESRLKVLQNEYGTEAERREQDRQHHQKYKDQQPSIVEDATFKSEKAKAAYLALDEHLSLAQVAKAAAIRDLALKIPSILASTPHDRANTTFKSELRKLEKKLEKMKDCYEDYRADFRKLRGELVTRTWLDENLDKYVQKAKYPDAKVQKSISQNLDAIQDCYDTVNAHKQAQEAEFAVLRKQVLALEASSDKLDVRWEELEGRTSVNEINLSSRYEDSIQALNSKFTDLAKSNEEQRVSIEKLRDECESNERTNLIRDSLIRKLQEKCTVLSGSNETCHTSIKELREEIIALQNKGKVASEQAKESSFPAMAVPSGSDTEGAVASTTNYFRHELDVLGETLKDTADLLSSRLDNIDGALAPSRECQREMQSKIVRFEASIASIPSLQEKCAKLGQTVKTLAQNLSAAETHYQEASAQMLNHETKIESISSETILLKSQNEGIQKDVSQALSCCQSLEDLKKLSPAMDEQSSLLQRTSQHIGDLNGRVQNLGQDISLLKAVPEKAQLSAQQSGPESLRRLTKLEEKSRADSQAVESLRSFVSNQQAKLDTLNTTAFYNSVMNHMARQYPAHPAHIAHQIEGVKHLMHQRIMEATQFIEDGVQHKIHVAISPLQQRVQKLDVGGVQLIHRCDGLANAHEELKTMFTQNRDSTQDQLHLVQATLRSNGEAVKDFSNSVRQRLEALTEQAAASSAKNDDMKKTDVSKASGPAPLTPVAPKRKAADRSLGSNSDSDSDRPLSRMILSKASTQNGNVDGQQRGLDDQSDSSKARNRDKHLKRKLNISGSSAGNTTPTYSTSTA